MSEQPVRLLAESGGATSPLERQLLRAGLDMSPPAAAKSEVWAALSARLAPPLAPDPSTTSAAVTAGAWKTGLVGFAAGLIVAGGAYLAAPSKAPASAPTSTAVTTAAPAAEPSLPAREVDTRPAPRLQAAPLPPQAKTRSPAAPTGQPPATSPELEPEPAPSAPAASTQSQLREESRLLREARTALRSGAPGRALALLEESRGKHPQMVLGQEHEALTIEALAASGSRAAARDRARVFIARFPTSPHATKLRSIAEAP